MNIVSLYQALLRDLDVDDSSSNYLLRRLSCEGHTFVTRFLPSFSKHLLRCLEQGVWSSFGTSIRVKQGLPVLFRGFLEQIFEYDIHCHVWRSRRSKADPVSIWVIRQACEFFYKLALPFSSDQVATFYEKFLAVEETVLDEGEYDAQFVDTMRKRLETYFPSVCAITHDDIAKAAHPGPGTFSECSQDWYLRNYSAIQVPHAAKDVRYAFRLNKRAKLPDFYDDVENSEVLFVPKDSRGPRVIVREPYTSLLLQMGYNACLSKALEIDSCRRVNTRDQSINRHLAKASSISLENETSDLEDASDRTSNSIVNKLYRNLQLGRVVRFYRTRYTRRKVPRSHKRSRNNSRGLIKLRKLAGMGSGFTFPTMALVIYLAICTHVSLRSGISFSEVMKLIYVYGDDIISPSWARVFVREALLKVGYRINVGKCYKYSHFRESCGGDYYYGNDVAPARLKLSNAGITIVGHEFRFENLEFYILGLERFARVLNEKQLYRVEKLLLDEVEILLLAKFKTPVKLPVVSPSSPILGRVGTDDEVRGYFLGVREGYCWERHIHVEAPSIPFDGMCPDRFLFRKLRKVPFESEHDWKHRVFPAGQENEFGIVTLPRKIRLKRRLSSVMVRL